MDYRCFNCDENTEIPELVTDPAEDVVCPWCSVNLELGDIYQQCLGCKQYFIKTYQNCPDCGRPTNINSQAKPLKYVYVTTDNQYQEAINFIESVDILGLDTEGNSLDPYLNQLFLIQIGNEAFVYIFDFNWHKKLAKESFWLDKNKLLLIHNVKYDYKVLKHSLGIELRAVFDTFLAERILTCGLTHKNGLKDVVEKYLKIEMNKEIREDFIALNFDNFLGCLSPELLEYAAIDVQLLPLIYERQKWDLINNGLMDTANLEFEVSKIVSEIELTGIHIDIESWKEIIKANEAKKQLVEEKMHKYLIDAGFEGGFFGNNNINMNSTKDLMEIFRRLGVSIKNTMDDELALVKHPFADMLREYREYEKQLTAFGEKFIKLVRKDTNRIYPSFQQIGADTGRFSCTNPNLQQIPSDESYRKCFTAPEGRRIVSVDYSQQELRILASLSRDPKFIKFYEDGMDLHTATASLMFNIPMDQVQKDTHRKIAKTINFGLAYGQGPKALGLTIGVDEKEAREMIDKYFAQFTYIRDWLDNAAKEAQKAGFSTTLMGRKRFYIVPSQHESEYRKDMSSIGRQGKNSPIQGSGADMVKLAILLIYNCLRREGLDAFLINIVHDEIILESSEGDAEKTVTVVKEAMIKAGKILAPNVPVFAEGGADFYWHH